jgi:hypothetical protein
MIHVTPGEVLAASCVIKLVAEIAVTVVEREME